MPHAACKEVPQKRSSLLNIKVWPAQIPWYKEASRSGIARDFIPSASALNRVSTRTTLGICAAVQVKSSYLHFALVAVSLCERAGWQVRTSAWDECTAIVSELFEHAKGLIAILKVTSLLPLCHLLPLTLTAIILLLPYPPLSPHSSGFSPRFQLCSWDCLAKAESLPFRLSSPTGNEG